jgi:deoxyribodipyrimidine photolyase-related protein
MELFYRAMRRKHGVLMDGDKPVGGTWNYDTENRGSFGKAAPGKVPAPQAFKPDAVTREVLELVERNFTNHPGSLRRFDWPVTRWQAQKALEDFIANRLPDFGRYEDAMWTGEPVLYHSRISAPLNLKLLDPPEVIAAAVKAYASRQAPLPAVEGFVRQILGWREYVRGVYWHFMPEYAERNAMGAILPLPGFYWTGTMSYARGTTGNSMAGRV